MSTQLVVRTVAWLCVMAAILLFAAGDWRWVQGWVFLAEFAVSSFALCFWLARHDPALLRSRTSAPWQPGQPRWDRIFMLVLIIMVVGWMVLIGLDAHRFRWSQMPLWLQPVGALLIALCMVVTWRTFRYNSFAAPQVRLQAERGQQVTMEGPYGIVRHPMYAGAIFFFVGMPMLLGSWWGMVFAPVLVVALAARAVGEEGMLRRELAGYDEYTRRVRFRMVPGVW